MPERQPTSFVLDHDQALIGIPAVVDGREVTRYVVESEGVDEAPDERVTQAALSVIGTWSDLDWNELEAALDRIRHESTPTPPIEL